MLHEAHTTGLLLRSPNKHSSIHSAPDYNMLSYREILVRVSCDFIEDTVTKRILLHVGRVARMHDERLLNVFVRR